MSQQETQTLEETTVSAPTSQQVIQKTKTVIPQVRTGSPQKEYQSKKAIFRAYQIIWYILGLIEVILAFRILLKLFGANTQNGFTSFIYSISNPFASPFAGILGITDISNMKFEWSTLIAMAVYAIVAYGIIALFQLVKPTNQAEVEQSVDNQ
jgi:hypothetical protein